MKNNNWIIGIGGKEQSYRIGCVTYLVSAHFEPPRSEEKTVTLKDRIGRSVTSDFIPLTVEETPTTMADEYVCSAAGEEDL